MAGKGGARPGAGRKPTRVKNRSDRDLAEDEIRKRLPDLIRKAIDLADAGDLKAITYLIDQLIGRARDRVEHDFSKLSDAELLKRATSLAGRVGPPRPDTSGR